MEISVSRIYENRKGYATFSVFTWQKKELNFISHSHRDNATYSGNIYAVPRGELNKRAWRR